MPGTTYTFIKKAGAPAGPITILLSVGSFLIDDTTHTSITTSSYMVMAALSDHPFLQLSSSTGTYVPPPVIQEVFLADGALSYGAKDAPLAVVAGGGGAAGTAGGVLAGTYPNPGFAQAMVTSAGLVTSLQPYATTTFVSNSLAAKADLVGGKIPSSQIPTFIINQSFSVASQAAMVALVANIGDIAIRTDQSNTTYIKTANNGVVGDWTSFSSAGSVVSVNGLTGTIVLTAANVSAVATSAVGAANGVAQLDGTSKVPAAQIPTITAAMADETLKSQLLVSPARTGAYTLVLADAGWVQRSGAGAAVPITVPPFSSVAFPFATGSTPGTVIPLRAGGTAVMSVVAGAGVTINSAGGLRNLRTQFSEAYLHHVGTDTWDLIGDLA